MRIIRRHDSHKWIVAMETGQGGFEHWQVRMRTRYKDTSIMVAGRPKKIPGIALAIEDFRKIWGADGRQVHVEECASDNWEYESKEGRYLASWDAPEVRRLRWGKCRKAQNWALTLLDDTTDREIMVWYDPEGCAGKSWLVGHLYETGQAYITAPYMDTIQSMVQCIASQVKQDREAGYPPRKYVIIDMPRSWHWSDKLYVAIEAIKDGLIVDPRYSASIVNLRGCKVIVLTNEEPKLTKLSRDRFKLYDGTPYTPLT